jgi:hypothetical protein
MKGQPWPQKGGKLFSESGDYYEFAHFGWGDVASEFSGYTEGYKKAADSLIERVLSLRDISKLDTFVFPILFLYRQYLELELKWIVLRFSECSLDEKKDVLRNVGHNLMGIWHQAKPLMLEEAEAQEQADVETVEDYIKQFHDFDETSFSFRYPITKNLEEILTREHRLNLSVLMERMEELYSFFSGVSGKLESIRDFKQEMESYMP